MSRAQALGLDGVCITDHGTMSAAQAVAQGPRAGGVCLLVGMEYATPEGDFLLFGPFENLRPGLRAVPLLQLVKRSGGVAVAAHPFRARRPVQALVLQEGLCSVVETVNGRNSDCENRLVAGWRRSYAFSECGGSDAHTLGEVGSAVTRFSVPVRSRHDLINALRQGLCRAEHGRLTRPVSEKCT